MTKPKSIPSRAAAVAAFWCVHLRTAQHWLASPGRAAGQGAPPTPPLAALDEPAAMLEWVRGLPSASQSKLTRSFRARCDLFRLAMERGQPVPLPAGASAAAPGAAPRASAATAPPGSAAIDPDWTAFHDAHQARTAAAPPGAAVPALGVDISSLKLRCAYADYKIGLAQQRGDHPSVREWTETLRYLSGVIHDEELRAQKLGRELGDMIPRPDYERQLKALAWWLVRLVDDAKATLSPRLAAASANGPLFRQEVDAILEPVLLTTRVLEPLRRATDLPAGTGAALPPWALNALRTALAAAIEEPAAPPPA